MGSPECGQVSGDPKKVAIAGESAGGNMAASICIMAKQKGVQMPVHQLLIYPVTNYAFDTQSYKENAASKPLSAAGMKWFFQYYLTKPEDGNDPRLSVLRNNDFGGLPPATIINAEIDPLRDEGEAYGKKLKAAGVPVTHKLYPGVAPSAWARSLMRPSRRKPSQPRSSRQLSRSNFDHARRVATRLRLSLPVAHVRAIPGERFAFARSCDLDRGRSVAGRGPERFQNEARNGARRRAANLS